MLTAERLRSLLEYEPETGIFRWRENGHRRVAGEVAGYPRALGYWGICLDGKNYYAHRLAWLYVHGEWPDPFADHINHNRGDNRIANLREATNSINQHNLDPRKCRSNTGIIGVSFDKVRGKFQAQFAHSRNGRKERYHRRFDTIDAAVAWLEEKRNG